MAGNRSLILSGRPDAQGYLELGRRLERDNVVLEDSYLSESFLCGTIRVKNISFCKKVFLRITHDNWTSHEDHLAEFESSSKTKVYDIFTFAIPLPAHKLEFSHVFYLVVGYEEGGNLHWDNNNGANYTFCMRWGSEMTFRRRSKCPYYSPRRIAHVTNTAHAPPSEVAESYRQPTRSSTRLAVKRSLRNH